MEVSESLIFQSKNGQCSNFQAEYCGQGVNIQYMTEETCIEMCTYSTQKQWEGDSHGDRDKPVRSDTLTGEAFIALYEMCLLTFAVCLSHQSVPIKWHTLDVHGGMWWLCLLTDSHICALI